MLSYSQAEPGRELTHPSPRLLTESCSLDFGCTDLEAELISTNWNLLTAVVSGWGTLSYGGSSPNVLQEVTVQVFENTNCGSYSQNEITSQMMCASGVGKDSCHGDSGGPLVTKVGAPNDKIMP